MRGRLRMMRLLNKPNRPRSRGPSTAYASERSVGPHFATWLWRSLQGVQVQGTPELLDYHLPLLGGPDELDVLRQAEHPPDYLLQAVTRNVGVTAPSSSLS